MKNILFSAIILLASLGTRAQDITIKISKSGGTFKYEVKDMTAENNLYSIDRVKDFTIRLEKAGDVPNYTVNIKNQSSPAGTPFPTITISDAIYLIPVGENGKINGGSDIELADSFGIIFNNADRIIFKLKAPDPLAPAPAPTVAVTSPATVPVLTPVITQSVALNYAPTGDIYSDALKLNTLLQNVESNQSLIFDILTYYTTQGTTKKKLDTWTEANNHYKKNRFISAIIKKHNPAGAESGGNLTEMLPSAASIGAIDVTKLADGFAKFIVKRTKQELSIAFFEKFKEELEKNKDIQAVFPQTYRALMAIGDEVYQYEAYIQTLRESFEKDLSALTDNLPKIIDNHADFFDKYPEIKAALQSGFYIAAEIKDGTHPGEIIENFPDENWVNAGSINYQSAFQTLKMFSKSFKNPDGGDNYWFESDELKKLFKDETLFYLYMGLIVEQAKSDGIKFKGKRDNIVNLTDVINNAEKTIADRSTYKAFLKDIVHQAESIELKIKELPEVKNDSLRFESYYSLVSKSLNLMKAITNIPGLKPDALNPEFLTMAKTYFDMAQATADIAIDVKRRNYASAIVNVSHLFDRASEIYQSVDQDLLAIEGEITNAKAAKDALDKASKKYKEAQDTLWKLEDKKERYITENYKNRYRVFFKYGSFMAAVAQAKNSDEVAAVIESFALPAGSSRIKRESCFNVSLNAYCGLFYGGEKIRGLDKCYKGTFGITAPIGVSVNFGKAFNANASSSIFLSFIDLGAVTAFRFDDSETESVPEIELKDIISPGIFYSFGIPKTPISVNLGYQIGPLLRKVKPTTNTYQENYSRISMSVVVDIPLLNLYTKSN